MKAKQWLQSREPQQINHLAENRDRCDETLLRAVLARPAVAIKAREFRAMPV
jgi:hypothetical protein